MYSTRASDDLDPLYSLLDVYTECEGWGGKGREEDGGWREGKRMGGGGKGRRWGWREGKRMGGVEGREV